MVAGPRNHRYRPKEPHSQGANNAGCGPRDHFTKRIFLWHLADTDTRPFPSSACGTGADVFVTHLLRQLMTQNGLSRTPLQFFGEMRGKNDHSQFLKFFLPLFGFTKKYINLRIRSTLCHSAEFPFSVFARPEIYTRPPLVARSSRILRAGCSQGPWDGPVLSRRRI